MSPSVPRPRNYGNGTPYVACGISINQKLPASKYPSLVILLSRSQIGLRHSENEVVMDVSFHTFFSLQASDLSVDLVDEGLSSGIGANVKWQRNCRVYLFVTNRYSVGYRLLSDACRN